MARVTVEDCVDKIPNRFDLVIYAAHRAREIGSGDSIAIMRDNDKNPVLALREIAEETQKPEELEERAIRYHQTENEVDEPDDEKMSLLNGGEGEMLDDEMTEELLSEVKWERSRQE